MAHQIHDLTAPYALDALEVHEREAFEAHLAGCETCRDELEGFWAVTGSLAAAAGGPPPPAELRNRVLREVARERATVVPLRSRLALPAFASVTAVAAVLAVGVAVWAGSLARKLDDARTEAATNGHAVAVLSDPAARSVRLPGVDGRVVVSQTGRAVLVVSGLEAAPAGKTYEVWVVEDGAPAPAGLFSAGGARTVVPITRPVPTGAVVAVTLEDEGGVEVPQGPPVFASPTL
ncbi:MAG TPA: anti-sigma factor [Gaiellaceae bacterium]|jgi:anti-sigma-K factor RskA|nr:anti-sigma factor [Gaiellaceae bacterium]